MRRIARWLGRLATAAAGAALVVAGAAVLGDRYVRSDPGACGTCHPMRTPLRLWAEGEHREVACQSCHRLERSDGLRMLWGMVRGAAPGERHARVDRAACAACHVASDPRWPQIQDTPGHRVHALEREIDCLACHGPSTHKVRPAADVCDSCHAKREHQ